MTLLKKISILSVFGFLAGLVAAPEKPAATVAPATTPVQATPASTEITRVTIPKGVNRTTGSASEKEYTDFQRHQMATELKKLNVALTTAAQAIPVTDANAIMVAPKTGGKLVPVHPNGAGQLIGQGLTQNGTPEQTSTGTTNATTATTLEQKASGLSDNAKLALAGTAAVATAALIAIAFNKYLSTTNA